MTQAKPLCRCNAFRLLRRPTNPECPPKAIHFLRSLPPNADIQTTRMCTYRQGVQTYIESLTLTPNASLSRDDLVYFHAEVQATIAALDASAKAYFGLRCHVRWGERQLVEVAQMSDRLRSILAAYEAALTFLATMERQGRVPTSWNTMAQGTSWGDALAFFPFHEVHETVSGRGWTNRANSLCKYIDSLTANLKEKTGLYPSSISTSESSTSTPSSSPSTPYVTRR
ncbi:hypothetical protein CspHIS471_0105300 [Cutaneotrichosporon sp. HIS471]|nr:hypothetical protein CspHIS471_0105300 [Cutaneotrichosporon sp. HIS471]